MNLLKKVKYLLILFIPMYIFFYYYQIYMKEPFIEAKAAILMDAESGEIIYKKMKMHLLLQQVCQK
ncbi:hypothetical protein OCA16_06540 [Bacillus cereus]|nr:hypothetical protein [Bacillus cereus]